MKALKVAIFIYNDAEVLDFAGPFEVFNLANTVAGKQLFDVFLVAETDQMVFAKNNFRVVPDYDFAEMPEPDILVIPGGIGRKMQMHEIPVLNWVKHEASRASYVLSVCTGAFILGNAGLLNHLPATTHHQSFDEFENEFPQTQLLRNIRYVDTGKVITSAGISAGIDMCLMLTGKLFGIELEQGVAARMEFAQTTIGAHS
ncbi:MAG: DJ-1/PfpI family protein [Chitinophagales bacterium]|nr:DJ-1/PfpI family protein [Chitinophagales bacterium]